MDDKFDLQRFLDAQQGTYETALIEIRRGAKRGHWMWFIFPQVAGLGQSATASRFGLRSLEEARAYLDHPVLGTRLRECVETLQDLGDTTAVQIFGELDAIKLRSSLTLFAAAGGGTIFEAALARWTSGADPKTLQILSNGVAQAS